jgi:CMP-N,N'-diacetyllegionaminic acid synthase
VNILAVILARAGSAGLKDKHLRPLLGRKVIDYTFDHARAARRLTRVVVSTDCPAIRNAAERKWFETIARPANLATSDASVQDVMLNALYTVESRSSFRADGLVVLYGNVPIRPASVIDDAVSLLESSRCDSVRSFCPVGKWHPSWMSWLDGDHMEPLQSGSIHRRQDLTPLFLHDGAVVAVSRESMLRGEKDPINPHAFFGIDRRAVRTGLGDTVEIDEARDLYLAEAVLRDRVDVTTRMAS